MDSKVKGNPIVAGMIGFFVAGGLLIGGSNLIMWAKTSDPETVIASSLKSVQEQNRLSAFAARFVTVVTSRQSQLGLSAEKTMIVPGMVRYEVDMAKVKQSDLAWNEAAKTLTVKLPPLEVAGPEYDLSAVREYGSGMVLMALTDVEKALDAQNRAKAKSDMLEQAKAEPMLRLARDATVRAVERSFALPLNAAGIEAKVKVETEQ
jgi:hypothetical protein